MGVTVISTNPSVAAPAHAPVGTPYQRVLRSIGAYLDGQGASQVYVLETEEGFLLRYQTHRLPFDTVAVHLARHDMVALDARHQGRRSDSTSAGDRKPDRYQDLMRAIGYELEAVAARHIVLDEVDGYFSLTYHYRAEGGGPLRKYRAEISPAEAEELFQRARARRRPNAQRGWLRRPGSGTQTAVQLVRLKGAEACLDRSPSVVYEFTLPALKDKTVEVLSEPHDETTDVYKAGRYTTRGQTPLNDRLLRPFEAAALVSSIYSRCLDPVRFPVNDREPVRKDQVMAVFARCLTSRNVLSAVELVAANIEGLRALDTYQAGLGTTVVRWMQHLAAEALDVLGSGQSTILPEQGRLYQALSTIRNSVSGADRLAALRHSQSIR